MNIAQKTIIIALFGVPLLLGSLFVSYPMYANGQLEDLFMDIPTFASDNQTLDSTNLQLQDGMDGTAGQDGMDGTAGQDGKDSVPARDGKDGIAGRDGQDGADGIPAQNTLSFLTE